MVAKDRLKELDFYIKLPKTLIRILINVLIEIYLAIAIKKVYVNPEKYGLPTGTVTIRQQKKGDLRSIAHIFNESFTYLSFDENRKYIIEIKKIIEKYPTISIVAEYNEKCIGFITAKPELHLNKNHIEHSLHITWMAVDPSYRGHKISVKMLEYLIHIAKSIGNIEKIITQTNLSNIPAIKAYETLGFQKAVSIPKFMSDENGMKLEKLIES